MGKEVGENGTPHLQGYLELKTRMTFSSLKRNLGLDRIHLEPARGNLEQNQRYCKKDGQWEENGIPMNQGARSDLNEAKEAIDNGASELDLWENNFSNMVRYRNSLREYRLLRLQNNDREAPKVIVIWGPTGTGKTKFVHDEENPENLWNWGGDRWFDGYNGQPAALFDDFDGSQLHFRIMLKILDRYPINVPIKGAFVPWIPRRIYITSNIDPKMWFPQEDSAPLLRRFTEIKFMD